MVKSTGGRIKLSPEEGSSNLCGCNVSHWQEMLTKQNKLEDCSNHGLNKCSIRFWRVCGQLPMGRYWGLTCFSHYNISILPYLLQKEEGGEQL